MILYSHIGFNNNFDVDEPLYRDIMSRYGKTTPTTNRLQFRKKSIKDAYYMRPVVSAGGRGERERETDRQTDRQTETERQRERGRETETEREIF